MKTNTHKTNKGCPVIDCYLNKKYLHLLFRKGRGGSFHHIYLPWEQAKGSGSLLMNRSVRQHCYCHYEVFTSWRKTIRVCCCCCCCSWRRCWHWTWCQIWLLHCLTLDVDNLSNNVCRPVWEAFCEQCLGFRGQVVVWAVPVDRLVMSCLI